MLNILSFLPLKNLIFEHQFILVMIRKILAVAVTLITLLIIKETIFIFTTKQADIVANGKSLKIASVSICIPLIILCSWLWSPKNNNPQ
ncbi:hypothetical protein MASR2M52_19380 [Pedobacter sp.]